MQQEIFRDSSLFLENLKKKMSKKLVTTNIRCICLHSFSGNSFNIDVYGDMRNRYIPTIDRLVNDYFYDISVHFNIVSFVNLKRGKLDISDGSYILYKKEDKKC